MGFYPRLKLVFENCATYMLQPAEKSPLQKNYLSITFRLHFSEIKSALDKAQRITAQHLSTLKIGSMYLNLIPKTFIYVYMWIKTSSEGTACTTQLQ